MNESQLKEQIELGSITKIEFKTVIFDTGLDFCIAAHVAHTPPENEGFLIRNSNRSQSIKFFKSLNKAMNFVRAAGWNEDIIISPPKGTHAANITADYYKNA